MARPLTLVLSTIVFAAALLSLTLGYNAWSSHRLARRARAARRLGLTNDTLLASRERPVEHGLLGWLRQQMEEAGDLRSAREFLVQCAVLAAVGLTGSTWALHGPARALGLLLGSFPFLWLRRAGALRCRQITEQLPDAFDRIGRTLSAGHALSDALRVTSEELPQPLADELARVVTLQALGVDLRRALQSLSSRNRDNFDIRLFVSAVLLNRETGGNLVEILDQLAETVRERLIFDSKVVALTAEVRLSAWILGALPFAVAAVLLAVKPDYLSPLFESDPGRALLAGGSTSLLAAALLMRRLAAVEA